MTVWYDDLFVTEEWRYVHRHWWSEEQTEREADAVMTLLALAPGMHLLDVPCGEGRHAVALGRRGLSVAGIDLSAPLLEQARDKVAAGMDVSFQRADMRDIAERERFDAAITMWGSFGYFDDEGNLTFARAVHQALKPGGRWLIDTHVLESLMPRYQERSWHQVADAHVLERRRYDDRLGRIDAEWTFIVAGRETRHQLSLRIYSMPELRRLLAQAGFVAADAYGSLAGDAFAPRAPRAYVVARRS
jgi:SAM-dependent methyltransferase